MASPLWPTQLPFFLANLQETPGDGAVRFQPDAGPPITRLRWSSVPVLFQGSLILRENSQKVVLDTFFRATLAQGTLRFHFPDPNVGFATGNATSEDDPLWLFSGPPVYTHLVGDGTKTASYRANLSLEKQP